MRGKKYGDNPQFIIEELRKKCPNLDIVWLHNRSYKYEVPKWVRDVPYFNGYIRRIYEMATARVWISSHTMEEYVRKRKGQLFVETWHGGLGIKKIGLETNKVTHNKRDLRDLKNTVNMADVFISNSNHLTRIYRDAFLYTGPIYKCGYPKNDILVRGHQLDSDIIRKRYNLGNKKILLYAPTFRDSFEDEGYINLDAFSIDVQRVLNALRKRFGGEWVCMLKWHPILANYMKERGFTLSDCVDVTEHQDMQELLLICNVLISDYSSCLFDAALRGIPCFTYAIDFEDYKKGRGVYYNMDELPFSWARNNDEMEKVILDFDEKDYAQRWTAFTKKCGLNETGRAGIDIANKILDYMDGKPVKWEQE